MKTTLPPARKRVLIAVLVLGVGLSAERVITLARAGDEATQPAAARATEPRVPSAGAERREAEPDADAALRLDRLAEREAALRARGERPAPAAAKAGPFDIVSWAPPPPPAKPPPPPRPAVPPFPYTYMGSMQDAGTRIAFFNQGERALVVKPGDVVDGRFRVDRMSEQQMHLTYLPLNEGLTVALGAPR